MSLPAHKKYVIVGAGIHGLSTAYHLALTLETQGKGSGSDVIVLDKTAVGAGASGIACGVVRNNYFQPAMRELIAHSVEVWESDAVAFSYHPVGYLQISCEPMHEDIASVSKQQQEIGYESTFIEGADDCDRYMKNLFHDWQAQGITSVLHEKKGGYSNNMAAMSGLAAKAEAAGATIVAGAEVTAIREDSSGAISSVDTSLGNISCDYLIICAGPWVRDAWKMLELPETISIKNKADGTITNDIPMWTYWSLQEGTLGVDPSMQLMNDGKLPPVVHVDSDAPLYSDADGSLITEEMWGVYYKPDYGFGGVQGGATPFTVDTPAAQIRVDPYGPKSPEFVVGEDFAHKWVSGLAHCQKRFEGTLPKFNSEPSGGIGAFTPDSFPVFDHFRENCFVVADSNHGYKMIGVGKLVAEEVCGAQSELLKPFRFSRYAEGELHPVSSSPFPWS
ncbi:MAG: NAD(P)/FAD-dependent oxidoreductase [Woeseiales bacterium]